MTQNYKVLLSGSVRVSVFHCISNILTMSMTRSDIISTSM